MEHKCVICGNIIKIGCSERKTCGPECRRKLWEQTNMKRYGVTNAACNRDIINKRAQTMLDRYGVVNLMQLDSNKHRTSEKIYTVDENSLPALVNTEINREVIEILLQQFGIEYETNYTLSAIIGTRTQVSYDYDIYIPSQSVVISINSTVNNNMYRLNNERLHLAKTRAAVQNGLRCIHIFDWDSPEKITLLLKPKTRIYARNCVIDDVSQTDCDVFLNMFHLQNSSPKPFVRYGLYYDNQLVELMTLHKSRYNKKFEWELVRLCSDCDYEVVGGASKLFKHFIRKMNPDSVITYCDISKFTGGVYEQLGMKLHAVNPPAPVWSKGIDHVNERSFIFASKTALPNILFETNKSKYQTMLDNGWLPVHDCGQHSYVWTKE